MRRGHDCSGVFERGTPRQIVMRATQADLTRFRRGFGLYRRGHKTAVLRSLWNKLTGKDDGSPLERDDDPRGGMQSEEYRTADPRDVVEEDGVVMSAPGGTPQDDDGSA
jgi:hypothetical protein